VIKLKLNLALKISRFTPSSDKNYSYAPPPKKNNLSNLHLKKFSAHFAFLPLEFFDLTFLSKISGEFDRCRKYSYKNDMKCHHVIMSIQVPQN
jgi:hypothetical protein